MHGRTATTALGAALLVLGLAAPAVAADLHASVRTFQIDRRTVRHGTLPGTIRRGSQATFSVLYAVNGPLSRSAQAVTQIVLVRGRWSYTIRSQPARVRPGVWRWTVSDNLGRSYPAGAYRVTATVKLQRHARAISRPAVVVATVRFS